MIYLRLVTLSLILLVAGLGIACSSGVVPQATPLPANLPSPTIPPAPSVIPKPSTPIPTPIPQSAIPNLQSAIPTVDGDWLIVVQRSRQQITVYRQGKAVKSYTVSTGKPETITPLGWWKIVDKLQIGSPGIEGTRWLGWERWNPRTGVYEWDSQASPPFGIHGTNEPEKIGMAVSSGCVRLLNKDVEELFEMIPVGTYVLVVE